MKKKTFSKKEIICSNILFVVYLLFFGTLVVKFDDISPQIYASSINREMTSGFVMHFKTIEAFLLIFLLMNYEKVTNKKIEILIQFFIRWCVLYVPITLFIYFFVSDAIFTKPWYGRISVGYPTADNQILGFALMFLIFSPPYRKKWLKLILLLILIIGIILNNTTSGYITILLILLFYGIANISYRKVIMVCIIILLLPIAYSTMKKYADQQFVNVFEDKLEYVQIKLFNKEQELGNSDSSEKIRIYQKEIALSTFHDNISRFLGGHISIGALIENQYFFLLISYGYIGVFFYYSWLLYLFIYSVIKRNIFLILALLIYFVSGLGLISTYLFGLSVAFGLSLMYYIKNESNNNRLPDDFNVRNR